MNKRTIIKRMRKQAFYPYFGMRLAWRVCVPLSVFPTSPPKPIDYGSEQPFDGTWFVKDSPDGSETVSIGQVHGHKDHVPEDGLFVTASEYNPNSVSWWEATRTIWPGEIGKDRDNATSTKLPVNEVADFIAYRDWYDNNIHMMAHAPEGCHPVFEALSQAFASWPKNAYLLEMTDTHVEVVVSCKPNYMPHFATDMAAVYREAHKSGVEIVTRRYGYDIKTKSRLRIEAGRNDWKKNRPEKVASLAMRDWRKRRG